MRFMVHPGTEHIPNPNMTPEQTDVVVDFLEELRGLGIL